MANDLAEGIGIAYRAFGRGVAGDPAKKEKPHWK